MVKASASHAVVVDSIPLSSHIKDFKAGTQSFAAWRLQTKKDSIEKPNKFVCVLG